MFRGLNNFQPMFNNDRNVFEWLFTESKSNKKITNILHKETFTVFEPVQKLKTFYYALYVTFFLSDGFFSLSIVSFIFAIIYISITTEIINWIDINSTISTHRNKMRCHSKSMRLLRNCVEIATLAIKMKRKGKSVKVHLNNLRA